jgi:hypothetical protein
MARLSHTLLGLILMVWLGTPLYAHHAIPNSEIQDRIDELLESVDSPHLDLDLSIIGQGTMLKIEITLAIDEAVYEYDIDDDGTADITATTIDALVALLVDYVLSLDVTTWSISVTTADTNGDGIDDVYLITVEFVLTPM